MIIYEIKQMWRRMWWKIDPEAAWLIKGVERYDRGRHLVAFRLQALRFLIVSLKTFCVVTPILALYYGIDTLLTVETVTPNNSASMFDRKGDPELLEKAIKAGCEAEFRAYDEMNVNHPSKLAALAKYRDCMNRKGEFSF